VNKFQIIGFDNLAAVINELRQNTSSITFVNGGTDFINQQGEVNFDYVIDLSQVSDLQYIKEDGNMLRIGAGTTFADIAKNKLVQEKVTALAQAAAQVGSVQIRNRATIGGNIASASPAGDSLPVLAAFDAGIIITGPKGVRTITAAGIGKAALREKELITEIRLPLSEGQRSCFGKIGSRTAVSIAKLNMAMQVHYDCQDNQIIAGKIALGALGAIPVCPVKAQEFLVGRKVDEEFAVSLADLLSATVNEVIPDRASRPYKAQAVKGLTFDIINSLLNINAVQQLAGSVTDGR
jgi:carbon-monoxide dehydrogenase medium subunit